MTSHDVVAVIRRAWQTPRAGHTGTLDPLAAGVLPVLLGQSTRLAPLLTELGKSYRATVLFGLATDTGDLAGRVTAWRPASVAPEAVGSAVAGLAGRSTQSPPAYSARRVRGRRLYELARQGQADQALLDRASREIHIYSARLLGCGKLGWGEHSDLAAAVVDLACSSGTYVRTFAERLGNALGQPACLAFLLRTSAGGLRLADCLTLEQALRPAASQPQQRFPRAFRAPAAAVGHLAAAVVTQEACRRVARGANLERADILGWIEPVAPAGEPGEGGSGSGEDGGAADAAGRDIVRLLDEGGVLLGLARPLRPDARGATGAPGPVLHPFRVFAGLGPPAAGPAAEASPEDLR
jgi:tRNA pseudouridine55 synthase